jgi:hypothetical protein
MSTFPRRPLPFAVNAPRRSVGNFSEYRGFLGWLKSDQLRTGSLQTRANQFGISIESSSVSDKIGSKSQASTYSVVDLDFDSDSGGKKVVISSQQSRKTPRTISLAGTDIQPATLVYFGSVFTHIVLERHFSSSGLEDGRISSSRPSCVVPIGMSGYNHDDLCSFGNPQGKHQFWWPCAGSFVVDIIECCKNHDRQLYCSSNVAERVVIDIEFTACVIGKLINTASYHMSGWCEWIALPLLTASAMAIIGPVLLAILEIAGEIYQFEYTNFALLNKDSCLCGGSNPTLKCGLDPTVSSSYLCGFDEHCCRHESGTIIYRDGKPCTQPNDKLPPCPLGYAVFGRTRNSR